MMESLEQIRDTLAHAKRVDRSPTCRVRMMPVAGTPPSLSEPASRNMSSQYGAIFCGFRRWVAIALSEP